MSISPLEHPDPVAAFWEARRRGCWIRLETSGTTSAAPRTIVRSTGSWVGSFDECARRLGLGPTSRFWIPGPLRATMNLFAACLASHAGASWSTSREGCTHAQLTPAQLHDLLDEPAIAGLHALVAGDALGEGLRRRAEALGVRTSHYYGAAELSLVAWGEDAEHLQLFDAVECRIRSGALASRPGEGRAPFAATATGELWVRSPWLARVDTEDGFASVGDLARLDGDRLTVLGRPGACTTAGATVLIAPIERSLQERCRGRLVVVAVPDERCGELLACICPVSELDEVRRWARRELHGAHRPRRWLGLDELPVTPTGKVDRPALAALIAGTPHRVTHTAGTSPAGTSTSGPTIGGTSTAGTSTAVGADGSDIAAVAS